MAKNKKEEMVEEKDVIEDAVEKTEDESSIESSVKLEEDIVDAVKEEVISTEDIISPEETEGEGELGEEGEVDIADMSPEEKVNEYFHLKSAVKDMRQELRGLREEHPDNEELKQVAEKAKRLRLKIKEDEKIGSIQRDVDTANERMKLLKEIIKANLLQNNLEEIKYEGRVLKLVPQLKDVRDVEEVSYD